MKSIINVIVVESCPHRFAVANLNVGAPILRFGGIL
jgi:hypothetical protein